LDFTQPEMGCLVHEYAQSAISLNSLNNSFMDLTVAGKTDLLTLLEEKCVICLQHRGVAIP
jgi:hypothetical protein